MKNPREFLDSLSNKFNYKLKGDGPVEYHLGMDLGRDPDGTLFFGTMKYITKMMEGFTTLYGELPREATSPLVKNDHPEIDTSEELGEEGISIYMSLIGSLQWLISLGRFDVATAVMTMSRFRSAPRKGHMERVHRIYGYVRKFKTGCIRVRTEKPDYSMIPLEIHEWMHTVYGNVKELIPENLPTPLGKSVVTTTVVTCEIDRALK